MESPMDKASPGVVPDNLIQEDIAFFNRKLQNSLATRPPEDPIHDKIRSQIAVLEDAVVVYKLVSNARAGNTKPRDTETETLPSKDDVMYTTHTGNRKPLTEQRVFKIDVGDMSQEQANQIINKFKDDKNDN